ncbi:MAG: hypothetical protein AB7G06_08295 [Bdellovibrionales bacterium]
MSYDFETPLDYAIVVLSGGADREASLGWLQSHLPGCAHANWHVLVPEFPHKIHGFDGVRDTFDRIRELQEAASNGRFTRNFHVYIDSALEEVVPASIGRDGIQPVITFKAPRKDR